MCKLVAYSHSNLSNYLSLPFTAIVLFYNTERPPPHGMAVNYQGKKFYNNGSGGLYYKTFYGPMLVGVARSLPQSEAPER